LDINPAVPSSPFVTTATDVMGYSSFLGIATVWFGFG
jgi:magnesium transporter